MDIYETARTSIGLPLPLDALAIRMFRMVISAARSLMGQRNEALSEANYAARIANCSAKDGFGLKGVSCLSLAHHMDHLDA